MKNSLRLFITLVFGLVAAAGLSAADHDSGSHHHGAAEASATTPPTDNAEWLAAAKADYPLDTCVVSGDKLEGGDMGPPIEFVYKVNGQPDRLIRFCCKDCVRDFKKDPAKYLAMIDDAAAKKAAEQKVHSSPH